VLVSQELPEKGGLLLKEKNPMNGKKSLPPPDTIWKGNRVTEVHKLWFKKENRTPERGLGKEEGEITQMLCCGEWGWGEATKSLEERILPLILKKRGKFYIVDPGSQRGSRRPVLFGELSFFPSLGIYRSSRGLKSDQLRRKLSGGESTKESIRNWRKEMSQRRGSEQKRK